MDCFLNRSSFTSFLYLFLYLYFCLYLWWCENSTTEGLLGTDGLRGDAAAAARRFVFGPWDPGKVNKIAHIRKKNIERTYVFIVE